MIDSDRIIDFVYKQSEQEIIKFGVRTVLTELGFKVTEYDGSIRLNMDNIQKVEELFNQREIDKLKERLIQTISFNINKDLIDMIESEIIANSIGTVQDEIIKSLKLQLEQGIQTMLYSKFYDDICETLTDKLRNSILNDPFIKALRIKEL